MVELDRLLAGIMTEIAQSYTLDKLAKVKSASLGKNSVLSHMMKDLKDCSLEEKKEKGTELNFIKNSINEAIKKREAEIGVMKLNESLKNEYVDATLPARTKTFGKIHPLTKTTEETYTILSEMGFEFVTGPEIETDFFNFTALNIPEYHPARTMHDTFYVSHMGDEKYVLRTHTSPVQVRSLKKSGAPLYVFTIGTTYRSDSDATHTPMFHQIECLAIDKYINFTHLKWVINEFLKKFFQVSELTMRLRPSFFPFTEPSVEFDMAYKNENGRMIFGTGANWLEMGGGGIVHPNVLIHSGVDPEKYQGFAFGIGLERLTSLKYGISDLRRYFEYDKRFEDSFYCEYC